MDTGWGGEPRALGPCLQGGWSPPSFFDGAGCICPGTVFTELSPFPRQAVSSPCLTSENGRKVTVFSIAGKDQEEQLSLVQKDGVENSVSACTREVFQSSLLPAAA